MRPDAKTRQVRSLKDGLALLFMLFALALLPGWLITERSALLYPRLEQSPWQLAGWAPWREGTFVGWDARWLGPEWLTPVDSPTDPRLTVPFPAILQRGGLVTFVDDLERRHLIWLFPDAGALDGLITTSSDAEGRMHESQGVVWARVANQVALAKSADSIYLERCLRARLGSSNLASLPAPGDLRLVRGLVACLREPRLQAWGSPIFVGAERTGSGLCLEARSYFPHPELQVQGPTAELIQALNGHLARSALVFNLKALSDSLEGRLDELTWPPFSEALTSRLNPFLSGWVALVEGDVNKTVYLEGGGGSWREGMQTRIIPDFLMDDTLSRELSISGKLMRIGPLPTRQSGPGPDEALRELNRLLWGRGSVVGFGYLPLAEMESAGGFRLPGSGGRTAWQAVALEADGLYAAMLIR